MSKTAQKEKPEVAISNHPSMNGHVIVEVRLTVSKQTVAMIHEMAKIDPVGDSLLYVLAKRGFDDQFERKLESTHKLGRYYADYLRHKYRSDNTR